MKIVSDVDGSTLCEVSYHDPGVKSQVGDTVSFDGCDGEFRVVRVSRHHNACNVVNVEFSPPKIEKSFRLGLTTVFVIPISDFSERLPHED